MQAVTGWGGAGLRTIGRKYDAEKLQNCQRDLTTGTCRAILCHYCWRSIGNALIQAFFSCRAIPRFYRNVQAMNQG